MKERLKNLGAGAAGICVSFLSGKLLMAFSLMASTCFLTVILGIVWPLVFFSKKQNAASLIGGIFAIIFSGIIPALLTDYVGFGTSQSNLRPDQLQDHRSATIFTFINDSLQTSYPGYAPIMGRRYQVGDLYAFPLTLKNWMPEQEVPAWVLSEKRHLKEELLKCHSALHAIDHAYAPDAIKNAEKKYGLRSHPDAVLLRWSCNPASEWKDELFNSSMFPLSFFVIWGFISLIPAGKRPTGEEGAKKKFRA